MGDAHPDGTTALAILVPEAEEVVGAARARHDPSASAGIDAHVTLVVPFVPAVALRPSDEVRLAAVFRGVRPFRATFRRCRRFGTSTLYLAPEPGRAFVRMTEAVVAAYPAFPPYGGKFEEVVPHLTLADGVDDATLDAVEEALPRPLRIEADVREAVLLVRAGRRWSVRRRFPLGK